jgi:hypothetical protein
MTTDQADLINKKYKEMEAELNALKTTVKTQQDTITKQKVIIKTQIDTILKQEIVIKTQVDTITKYTSYPDNTNVYLMDLSHSYMTTHDFGIMMAKMLPRDYKKYQDFIKAYGLDEKAVWRFRNEMNIEYLPHLKLEEKKVWKYKTQYKK